MSYNSKYTGAQVEALLDIVNQGGSGGGEVQKTTEAEILAMGFTKNQGTITEVRMNGVSKGTSGVVDLGTVITEHQDISGKQNLITDLDDIREGAALGATALQSIPDEYVTESELEGKGYATTTQLNDKVDKVDGKQLSAEDFTTALKQKLESLKNYDDTAVSQGLASLQQSVNTLLNDNPNDAINSFNEIIAFLAGIEDDQSLSSIIASIEQQIAAKMDKVTLATVATSGSYNDLSNKPTIPSEQVNADWNATSGKAQILNKPTIPSAVTESTVSGWGFTKNTGSYSKPDGGIPKSDLENDVQNSLDKANTALQEHQDVSGKQDELVSGINIKTINGQSILGSGNITIEGGSGGGGTSSGGVVWTPQYVGEIEGGIILNPFVSYYAGEIYEDCEIDLELPDGNRTYSEYRLGFILLNDCSLTFIIDILWANGELPILEAGNCYELSIIDEDGIRKGVMTKFPIE